MSIQISQVKNKKQAVSKSQWMEKLTALMTKDITFGSKKMTDKKKVNFYNDLSILLSSGIDLRTTLDLMCEEATKKDEKELYADIREKVLNGADQRHLSWIYLIVFPKALGVDTAVILNKEYNKKHHKK